LKENNFKPRLLYPAKPSFEIEGEIKTFHNKQKLKQYMTIQPVLQKTHKESYREDEDKHSQERMRISNSQKMSS
jgi:hypothetical protein